MSELPRRMFGASKSGSAVSLRPSIGSETLAQGLPFHRLAITTGEEAATAAGDFWQTSCTPYEVIIRRLT